MVVKRSGVKEPFERAKLAAGIELAVTGSAVSRSALQAVITEIEEEARASGSEVRTDSLGLAVMERLRVLDPVSYLRFASVYKGFEVVADFEREVGELNKTTAPKSR